MAEGSVVLGRGKRCDLVLDHPSVSRTHARLLIGDGPKVVLEDLGSTNGVWFDGRRVERCEVGENETFLVGSVTCVLRDGVTLEASPTSPAGRPASIHEDSRGPGPAVFPQGVAAQDVTRPGDEFLPDRPEFIRRLTWSLHRRAPGLSIAAISETEDNQVLDVLVGRWDPDWSGSVRSPDQPDPASGCLILGSSGGPRAVRLLLCPWPAGDDGEPELRERAELLASALAFESTPGTSANESCPPWRLPGSVIAIDRGTRKVWAEATSYGRSRVSVLLVGESGVGKELLARRVHDSSPRSDGPYLALNCTAIPTELLEAELFGIERGVATGVQARPGKFRLASGGTLFLDEVGDLPSHLQPKLLRALETGEILPLGGSEPIQVDVRIVSATNQDLRGRTDDGSFRSDLFYRLAGAVIKIPPLRDRTDDIVPLARQFASAASIEAGRTFRGFEREFLETLLGYAWPGNVRELKHAIERAAAMAQGPILAARHLPEEVLASTDKELGETLLGVRDEWRTARDRFARLYFRNLLEKHGDNMSSAATKAGMSRSNLYKLLDELGLR